MEYGIHNSEDALKLGAICLPDWLVITPLIVEDPNIPLDQVKAGICDLLKEVDPAKVLSCNEDIIPEQSNVIWLDQPISTQIRGNVVEKIYPQATPKELEDLDCFTLSSAVSQELIKRIS